ncbi:MAG TPA: TolC family protein [Candidatus Omnitrophota bacterium]|nr:TolC family protein [Candidatus Omnitrophota bacterium]
MERFNRVIILLFLMTVCRGVLQYAPTAAFADEPNAYRLSLDDVTRLALSNNFDIQIAKYEAWIARTDNAVATSIYDTLFNAEVEYEKDKSKKTSTILGSKAVTNDYNVGLSQQLPTGTNISVDLINNRNWSDSSFTTSPLTHESSVGVTVEQDLGKNFFGIQDRGEIKVTKLEVNNKEYTSLDKIEFMLARAQKAYWDLALAKERVRIEEYMAEQAKRLYDLHQEKLKDGLVEVPEAIASQVNYEKRKNELTLARSEVKTKENVLKLLLNQTAEGAVIEPAQDLSLPERIETLEVSMKNAFDNRRDYKSARNLLKIRDIELTMKKNNLWPEINVTATLAQNGLGDHFNDAVKEVTEETNTDFFAGLTVEIPLLNTKARSQLKAAQLQKAKDIIGMKLLEKSIAIEVLDQVRNCNIFREVAENNIRIAVMEEDKLVEEEKRFNVGRSDTDTVIRFQEDLIQARWMAADAKYRYQVSLIDLQLKEATLLNSYWKEGL